MLFFDIDIVRKQNKEIKSYFSYLKECEVNVLRKEDDYLLAYLNDTYLYIQYDGEWSVFYSFEYGPLDTYAIMKIERNAVNAYVNLKSRVSESQQLFCEKIENYPSNEIRVGYYERNFANNNFFERVLEWRREITEDPYYITSHRDVTEALSVKEYFLFSKELIWLKCLRILWDSGYENNDVISIGSKHIKEDGTIQIYDLYNVKYDNKYCKELLVGTEVGEYLILYDDRSKYVVKKHLYITLKRLIQELLDPYEDNRRITVYVNENMEIIYVNDVFLCLQKMVLVTNDIKYFLDAELKLLEKKMYEYSGKEYVNKRDIIDNFKRLLEDKNTSEKDIQNYLAINYEILLGKRYDDIRCEVEIVDQSESISQMHRRIDIAVHDRLDDDWHIYELKLPHKQGIIRTRGIVSFSSEVNKAISQVLLYKELLSQSDIKKKLVDKYGLTLRHPKYYLLIGMQNENEWKKNTRLENRLEILSYSELIERANLESKWI